MHEPADILSGEKVAAFAISLQGGGVRHVLICRGNHQQLEANLGTAAVLCHLSHDRRQGSASACATNSEPGGIAVEAAGMRRDPLHGCIASLRSSWEGVFWREGIIHGDHQTLCP